MKLLLDEGADIEQRNVVRSALWPEQMLRSQLPSSSLFAITLLFEMVWQKHTLFADAGDTPHPMCTQWPFGKRAISGGARR